MFHRLRTFRLPWRPVSDDEYIAKLRRTIVAWDRFRAWMVFVHLVVIGGVIWLSTKVVEVVLGVAQGPNAPLPLQGFVIGAVLGLMMGWMLYGAIHSLMFFLTGMRSERLLLKYRDALYPPEADDGRPRLDCKTFRDLRDRVEPL